MKKFDIQDIITIARDTGDRILLPNWGLVARSDKADGSAVTVVDKQASEYILTSLQTLTPEIPVISEEATEKENISAMNYPLRWVVDPFDGTATYLDGPDFSDEAGFGIHIALVDQGIPIQGVAYFPTQKRMYFTGNDGGAYMQIADQTPDRLQASRRFQPGCLRVAVPWVKHKRPHSINEFEYKAVPAVGGEQLCKVARGEADLVWHDRPDQDGSIAQKSVFSHWDVAASHAILRAASGDLYEISTGNSVTYENTTFTVPACVAGHVDVLRQIDFHAQQNNIVITEYMGTPE